MADKDMVFLQEQPDGSFKEKTITPTASQYLGFDGSKDPISAAAVDSTKLPLAGGTMTGNLNMGTCQITNAAAICATQFHGGGANITGVTDAAALPKVGGTMTGNINMGTCEITNAANICATTFYGDGSNLTNVSGGVHGSKDNCGVCHLSAMHTWGGISDGGAILSGHQNSLCLSDNTVMLGGYCNLVCCAKYVTQLGGFRNSLMNCGCSSVFGGGSCNIQYGGSCSVQIGGHSNCLSCSDTSIQIGGSCNTSYYGQYHTMIGGYYNKTIYSEYSALIGGHYNCICCAPGSAILAGAYNKMWTSSKTCCSAILGGRYNCIYGHSNAFIVGSCLTANSSCWAYMNNAHACCGSMCGGIMQADRYFRVKTACGVTGKCNGVCYCGGIAFQFTV